MSGNSSGLKKELSESIQFHHVGVPLLVSSQLLRERSMGQIDLARLRKERNSQWVLEIMEVKSSIVGEEMLIRGQRSRLYSSQNFLSSLFGISSKLIRQS